MSTNIETTTAQPPRSRADISRENGAKSRGPKTPEGKARSSMNAAKDGLFAKTVILPGENREEFQALLDAHIARHQPEGEDELHLVYTMALCQWQERRIWRAETVKLEERLESNEEYDRKWDKKDAERRLGDAFNDALTKLNILGRMSSRIARDYQRALRTLAEIRKCKNEPSPVTASEGPHKTCDSCDFPAARRFCEVIEPGGHGASLALNPMETNERSKLPSAPLVTEPGAPLATSHSPLVTEPAR